MFESLEPVAPDAIIGLIAEYKNDPRASKIDLGIGVYKTANGDTPVLDAVKKAERRLVDTQASKAYIGSAGPSDFNAAIKNVVEQSLLLALLGIMVCSIILGMGVPSVVCYLLMATLIVSSGVCGGFEICRCCSWLGCVWSDPGAAVVPRCHRIRKKLYP